MIGLVSASFKQLTVEEIVNMCKAFGVEAIEWSSDIHVPIGNCDNAAYVRELSKNHSLITYSYGSYYRIGHSERPVEAFREVAKTAKTLGCKLVRIWTSHIKKWLINQSIIDNNINELKQLIEVAKELDII